VPWDGVQELCQPTVHDIRLHAAIGRGMAVSPERIRAISRAVAIDGSAGRAARSAALAADQTERGQIQRATEYLIRALPALGGEPPDAGECLRLGSALHRIGLAPGAETAGVAGRMSRLAGLRDGVAAWIACHDEDAEIARPILAMAALAIACATHALQSAKTGAGASALTQAWRSALAEMDELSARPDWILDGWEWPCLLWEQPRGGGSGTISARLTDIARLAPALPREVQDWTGIPADPAPSEALKRLLRRHRPNADDLQELTARNESLRALAA
jgi:hypothetical protein